MSIRSVALKTAVILSLATMPFPGASQQSSTSRTTRSEGTLDVSQATVVTTSVVLTITTPPPISYGEVVGGYALVSSSDGTTLSGSVTFYDGGVNVCTIPVTQTTSCPPSAGTGFAVGTHMLTAMYSGDATHLNSTANTVPVVVLPNGTTVSLTSSADPATYGHSVVFTATVQGDHAIPLGQIEFLDGASLIATSTLNLAGVATVSASALTLGTHPITARYAATQNFDGAASAALNQLIEAPVPAATITTLASNIDPAYNGQSVTFNADVMAPGQSLVPAGAVTFLDGSTRMGTAVLNGQGSASFSTAALATGRHAISASYVGSSSAVASSSAPLSEVVTVWSTTAQNPFTITVKGASSVDAGRTVNLLVTVAPRVGSIQPVQLSCADLPSESACTFGTATLAVNGGTTSLQISTMSPHSCGSATSYSQNAGMPFTGPALAGLMLLVLPRRRRKSFANLLMLLVAVCGIATVTGCGNCSDLGTRPGDYTIKVIGSSAGTTASTVIAKVALHVTVP